MKLKEKKALKHMMRECQLALDAHGHLVSGKLKTEETKQIAKILVGQNLSSIRDTLREEFGVPFVEIDYGKAGGDTDEV